MIPSTLSTITTTISYQNKNLEDLIKKYAMYSDINLNQQNLTDQNMDIIVQQAIINKQCKKLSLENNIITSQGAITIANSLNNNITLEALMLYHNNLSDLGVRHLSKVLSTNNSNLKILGIGSNNITDNGIQYLAQMLKKNQSLIVLGLVFNEITDQGVRLLTDVLTHGNQTLQVLHLSKNKSISNSSFESLNYMLKRNHSLRELWMQNCNLSDNIKQSLRQIIRSKYDFRLEL
ncbi:unnamed protein product [Rotaria sp. Silwood1]|nr:unnamed protein product [Rotaria sp. Silwood1]CAF3610804.1 unnamed protein product [Rotaria sp. Silwood1]CAF3613008.1 unnamed protein product [Rotaria sp. Silwood1]CAF4649736.1 unnamed protein product [Rotaria sp. Silwood1]CAF4781666.1 unnamed protein product [Rotaria sp. Silwood1]